MGRMLFDHLIGAQQDRGRQLDADRLGGFEVDHHLKFRGVRFYSVSDS